HARMANILKRGAVAEMQPDASGADLDLLSLPEERLLLHLLWLFPEVVSNAAKSLEPHHIAIYLDELAKAFHRYYTVARVVTDDRQLSLARLVITDACRQTLANGLTLLGIAAPERM
ncbi:MAG: arginine--tRNA ligase, partial [Candidatus Marinimicrobia bacterium]|nr:arginine--tRNA ligase [Candidatus Neomarinimicrobiota bacterium]